MKRTIVIAAVIFVGLWLMIAMTGRGCRPGFWANDYWTQVSYRCHFGLVRR